jgi:hypothetical protein
MRKLLIIIALGSLITSCKSSSRKCDAYGSATKNEKVVVV